MLRMVRDAFHIPGKNLVDARGHVIQISLNQPHDRAASFIDAFASFLACDGTVANLRQILIIMIPRRKEGGPANGCWGGAIRGKRSHGRLCW